MEQEAIEGQDLEMLIALQEMELNSTLNEASQTNQNNNIGGLLAPLLFAHRF